MSGETLPPNPSPPSQPPKTREEASSAATPLVVPEELSPSEASAVKQEDSPEILAIGVGEIQEINEEQQESLARLLLEEKRLLNQGLWFDITARRSYANRIFMLIVC